MHTISFPRANPVPDKVFQTVCPELATMSRDDLKALADRAKKVGGNNPLAAAVLAEWNGRVCHLKDERLKAEYVVTKEEVSFRMEVIEELVTSGIARHVAANLTNTEAKLMAKAKEIGYI